MGNLKSLFINLSNLDIEELISLLCFVGACFSAVTIFYYKTRKWFDDISSKVSLVDNLLAENIAIKSDLTLRKSEIEGVNDKLNELTKRVNDLTISVIQSSQSFSRSDALEILRAGQSRQHSTGNDNV